MQQEVTIEITTPEGDVIFYEPRGDFSLEGKRKKNQPEFEVTVPTFTLYGEQFETIYDFEKNHDIRIFDVKVFCQSSLLFDGFFTIFDCKFCEDSCSVEFDVQAKLKLNCIEQADVEYNLLKSPSGAVPRFTGYHQHIFLGGLYTFNLYYPQSMKIVDVINWFLDQNCDGQFNLESDILTNATNYVTGQPNELLNLYIEEMSDAAIQGAVAPASVLNTSLQRILDDLYNSHRLVWWLEGLNLRIEHESFLFDRANAIDLTQMEIVKMYKCYEYDFDNVPKSVALKFEQNKDTQYFDNVDFAQGSIVYKDATGSFFTFATGQSESTEIKGVGTDLISIAFTEGTLDDYVYLILEDNGNPELDVEVSTGILSGINQPNNKLSISYLLENYHNHSREYIAGEVNGSYKVFESVIPYKQQEDIVLKFDCNEFQTLDFAKQLVKTNLSYGIVDTYTIDLKECQITLKTKIY